LENLCSLIISTKYDWIKWVRTAGTALSSSSERAYSKLRETVSCFSDLSGWRPFEDPLWTKHPSEKPSRNKFDGPFKAQLVSGRCLVIFPAYAAPKASSGDCHKSQLGWS
jgi:hypothetical protein